MKLTREIIAATFPTLAVVVGAEAHHYAKLLAMQLLPFSDRDRQSEIIAQAMTASADGVPYNACPGRVMLYRAVIDQWLNVCPEGKEIEYTRAVARATIPRKSRHPAGFRAALLDVARRHSWPVSSIFVDAADPSSRSMLSIRLPAMIHSELDARARAAGCSSSELVRTAIYDYLERNQENVGDSIG